MESGNVFNVQDCEENEIPFKQRSFEDSIDTFFSLFDADLFADMDEYFPAWFPLPPYDLPGLTNRTNNFVRGVYIDLCKIPNV